MDKEFLLGFWNYQDFGKYDEEAACEDWKKLGCNFAASFEYDGARDRPEQMLRLLTACADRGIRLLVVDKRTHWRTLTAAGERAFRAGVREAAAEFGDHPACYAFFVGDEPGKDEWEDAGRAAAIVNEELPGAAFLNFYPAWLDDFEDLMGVPKEAYADMLAGIVKRAGLTRLAYDCYGCMCRRNRAYGLDMYFYNLNLFHGVASRCGIPCFTSLLAIGHWDYKIPSFSDMRWQLATALAHGMRGVQWFALYELNQSCLDNWENYPIDFYGEKQPSFSFLSKAHRNFSVRFGALAPYLALEKVWHHKRQYGGTAAFDEGSDARIRRFSTTEDTPAIVSRFRHETTGDLYYLFVNASLTENSEIRAGFDNGEEESVWLSPGGMFLKRYEAI